MANRMGTADVCAAVSGGDHVAGGCEHRSGCSAYGAARSFQHVALEKKNHGVELKVLIPLLAKAMPFVLSHQQPDRCALFLQRGDDLPRFAHRQESVVFSSDDENGLGDFFGVLETTRFCGGH